MKVHTRSRIAAFFLTLILLGFPSFQTGAQDTLNVQVSSVYTESFPDLVIYASVSGADGSRISDLTTANFSILEDENEIPVLSVQEERLGTRQIYVLNTSLAIGLRDASGQTRLDYANQALFDWWQMPDAARIGLDDLSLYTAESILAEHESTAALLAARLASFIPDYELETFPYLRVQQALRLADDPLPREGMTTSLIFLSPLVRGPELENLEDTILAAQENSVRVFTILLADQADLENPIVEQMGRLSEETGGEMMLFDPELGLTDLAQKVISQQNQYILHFNSQANSSGSHSLTLLARTGGATGNSAAQTFNLNIQPPSITFKALPETILRETGDPALPLEEIQPTEVDVLIEVAFPDGHPRELTSTSLWVDGEKIQVNTSAPFDRFTWNISELTASAALTLSARVEDSLGLSADTSEQTIQLDIQLPPSGLAALQPILSNFLFTLAGILLGATVIAGIVLFIRKSLAASNWTVKSNETSNRQQAAAPVRGANFKTDETEAVLTLVGNSELSIDLVGIDHIIGHDPSLATIFLNDPSVDSLHARLIRHANGKYMLKDTGSTAGTWVNFHQIPESGMILHHGDLIHFGRTAFRFVISSPPGSSTAEVTVLDPPEQRGEQIRLDTAHDPNK
ncbi:MAG: FHA domain-containing protein [Anaerolineales bacterium]|nr:FHA domain-containing protein [Anaerolineales bacterium]